MWHPEHRFSKQAPPCKHPICHAPSYKDHIKRYDFVIWLLQQNKIWNVKDLEVVLDEAAYGVREALDIVSSLNRSGFDYEVLEHYYLLGDGPPRPHGQAMGIGMSGGMHNGGLYIPSGAPGNRRLPPAMGGGMGGLVHGGHHIPSGAPLTHHHHHHHPSKHPGPGPAHGRDGRGVPYIDDTGSEASLFPSQRVAQARDRHRSGGRQPSRRDRIDRLEALVSPPRRRGRQRRDEEESGVESDSQSGSESEDSAPPKRHPKGSRNRRERSPEISERRERIKARRRSSDEDEDSSDDSSPPRRSEKVRKRRGEEEDSSDASSSPPPRRSEKASKHRNQSPEISERRTRIGARKRQDEDSDSGSDEEQVIAPPAQPPRRAGGDAPVEERRERVKHTGKTNMHWKPGALRYEDIQELPSSGSDEEEQTQAPAKTTTMGGKSGDEVKQGGKSGGGAKEDKAKPRNRY